MADDLSLLFRLRAENTQAKAVLTDTRASVAQLRQSFGPQLSQTVTVTNKAFSDLGDNLNNFVAQRVPLVGGAIVRVTQGLRGFSAEGKSTEKAIAGVAKSIESIATQSGKTVPAIASFLTKFIQLEGQAKRDKAAIDFFGASLGAKLIPELEKTGTALAGVAGESAAAGSSIAALAGPVAIVVIALAAMAAGAVIAGREIFQLTKNAAEFQGKMFDLAQQTGLAVETLSALEVAAKTTGGSIDTIAQAIVQFQRKLDDAQDPLSKTAEQFRRLNVDTSDTETSLRSAFTALARMPEGFAQTNAAAELFGARGGKQVLAILKETGGSIDETIKKLRELGILISEDSARAADKFNDELALLEFQLRALGAVAAEDLIPVLTELIRSFGDLVRASRPLISTFGTMTSFAIRPAADALKGLSLIVLALTKDYQGLAKAIRESKDAQNIPAQEVPDVEKPEPPKKTERQEATDAANQADAVVAAVKRSVAEQNQALDELFQAGRRNRAQQAEETIASNSRILAAEKQRIDAQLTLKEQEIKALDEAQRNRGEIVRRDTEDYRAITREIGKLQQERLDKENEFEVSSRAIRAKAAKERADSTRNQIRNESDLLSGEFDRQIKDIEARISRQAIAESDGLTIIEQLEQAKIDARIQALEQQREVGLLTVQDQVDLNNELKKLEQERDQLGDEQRNRRLDRDRAAAQRTRDILIANLDTLLQIEQFQGEQRIAILQALADLRVLTEEDAAKKILKIRLDLLDDEIETTKSKLAATGSIADKDERVRAEADLNNQLKILTAQRKATQDAGNRDIDLGRQQDIENERRYADELEKIRERTARIERDTARTVIDLMVLNFARREDVIKAQLELELKDAAARHKRIADGIKQDQLDTDARIRFLTNFISALKAAGKETSKEHEKAVDELRAANARKAELHTEEKSELEKSEKEKLRIRTEAAKALALAGPGGGLISGLESGQLAELQNGVQSFADVATVAFSAVGAVVNQLASGIGSLVQNFVLLGSNGPNAFRKLVASVLAGVAAQAATLAIMELAYGIAALTPWGAAIYGPAPFHFKSAALFGSVALATGLAGRGVAGGLFQPGGAGGAGDGAESPRELNPLNLQRNAGGLAPDQQAPQIQPIRVTVNVVPDGTKLANAFTAHVVEDFNSAGPIRQVISGDGNLNRG